jgi:hypothetical protein
MKNIYEPVITIGSGLAQAATSILLIKLNIKNLSLDEIQLWIISLAILPFYALIDFGVTSILPKKLSEIEGCASSRYYYIKSFIKRAKYLHIGSLPFIFIIFFIMMYFEALKIDSAIQIILLVFSIALRAYLNIHFGIIYSLGKNTTEKEIRVIMLLSNLLIIYLLSESWGYSFEVLLIINILTFFSTLFITSKYLNKLYAIREKFDRSKVIIKVISNEEKDVIKTTIPGMFIINSLPFFISFFLTPRDNINFLIAQQIYNGLGVFVLMPVTIAYKKIASTFLIKKQLSKKLLLRVINETSLIIIIIGFSIFISLDKFLSFIGKDLYLIDKTFIILFIALMSFEWIQTVMTRGLMAAGHYNFWRQTTVAAILTLIFSIIIVPYIGLYGVIISSTLALIPTCHFINIRTALVKFKISLLEFMRYIFIYLLFLLFSIFWSLSDIIDFNV